MSSTTLDNLDLEDSGLGSLDDKQLAEDLGAFNKFYSQFLGVDSYFHVDQISQRMGTPGKEGFAPAQVRVGIVFEPALDRWRAVRVDFDFRDTVMKDRYEVTNGSLGVAGGVVYIQERLAA